MITDYRKVKTEVLKQYDAFLSLVQEVKGDAPATFDSSLEQLQRDVEDIRKDIFRLMIVGEAKSGKSTFINAYLGKEILPMDVKQCTSAIVEIRDGEKYKLTATYADGRVKDFDREEDIKKFLKENAALDDEHREIPVGTINLQLIIPNKGKRIPEIEIKELLGMIANDNLYHLPPAVYEKKVCEYIEMKNPYWNDLVKKIEIEYPFEDENLKGIQIVDSPGVNAEGRVGAITNKYIANAHAVMFLKPIVGASFEASSFQNFLKRVSDGRDSNAMFLVLTRAANETIRNVGIVRKSACDQLPDFNKEQIICLDSKVAMFRNKIKAMTGEELKIFMEQKIDEADRYNRQIKSLSGEERNVFITKYKDADTLDDFLLMLWFRSQGDRDDYIQRLDTLSNFKEIDVALSQFGHTAQFHRLSKVLEQMLSVLCKIHSELDENIKLYREKAHNEDIQKKIEAMESQLGQIPLMISSISALKGGIDRFVLEKRKDLHIGAVHCHDCGIREEVQNAYSSEKANQNIMLKEIETISEKGEGAAFMITDYGKEKTEVLEQYDAFLSLVQEVKGYAPATFDSSLEQLQRDVEDIKKNIFRLMIVGEAKSGKSTFINAYLGKEILPMDVKQCTSAIVEIRDGEKYKLTATYADGRAEDFDREEDIKKFLKENAALDDEHREIPVSTINLQLIIPNKGKRIPEAEMKELLGMIANDNLYHLPPDVYEKKVREYIEMKNPHWKDLVQAIEIEYPFEDENLKGIQIVDSPGVNAEGRVGAITSESIVNAHAVMFLKPIVGSAVEASSFQKFLEGASDGRDSNTMFLVLTRAANEIRSNVVTVSKSACDQLPGFNKGQIICLDSKVAMFRNKVKAMTEEELKIFMKQKIDETDRYNNRQIKSLSGEERNALITKDKDVDTLDDFLLMPWFLSQGDRDDYIRRLDELSNFKEIDVALSQFGRTAQFYRLSKVLERMLSVLCKIHSELDENIGNYKEKIQNPGALERKLSNAKHILEELRGKINVKKSKISSSYTSADGIIVRRSSKIIDEYKKEMDEIDPNGSTCIMELEKLTFRKIEEFKKFEAEITKNIIAECDETLIALGEKEDLNYVSLVPDITSDILAKVKVEGLKEAMETYTTGDCFKETHERLNQSKYFNIVSGYIGGLLVNIRQSVIPALNCYIQTVMSAYHNELAHNIKLQKDKYDRILKDKANEEEMQRKIEVMGSQLCQISLAISSINTLKVSSIDTHICEEGKGLYKRAVRCHECGV